jgi:hypothetical protein
MSLELSDDQRQAVNTQGTPLQIVDPRTGSVYVLVKQNVFERVQSLLADNLAETYPAQIESAMRAGWDDPLMDEYNDYNRHRKQ